MKKLYAPRATKGNIVNADKSEIFGMFVVAMIVSFILGVVAHSYLHEEEGHVKEGAIKATIGEISCAKEERISKDTTVRTVWICKENILFN